MLWEDGACNEATAVIEPALQHGADVPLLYFNHAVAMEDLSQTRAAQSSDGQALALDPLLADAHFNLAKLLHGQAALRGALRHWNAYPGLQREQAPDTGRRFIGPARDIRGPGRTRPRAALRRDGPAPNADVRPYAAPASRHREISAMLPVRARVSASQASDGLPPRLRGHLLVARPRSRTAAPSPQQ
jgi:hypothetical protein